jgi:putative ABC transport system substrate-binding protein
MPRSQREAAEGAARTLGLDARVIEIPDLRDLDAAFRDAKNQHADALHVLPSPVFNHHRVHLTALAAKYGLPAIYEVREYVEAGGLMSYGPSYPDMYRRAASYVDRILKGARPGDLPIEQPAKFELVIDGKTAKVLGLSIPPSILLRASQVIE